MNTGGAEKCCSGTEVYPELATLAALALRGPARVIISNANVSMGRRVSILTLCFMIDSFFQIL
jgi:hypothetical protein